MGIDSARSSPPIAAISRLQTPGRSPVLAPASADAASPTRPAELFRKLESLSKSDPAKFKDVAAAIATKLGDAADVATDPNQKQMLTELAGTFTEAARTGDASDLKPSGGAGGPPPGGGAGGPPPGGGAGGPPRGGAGAAARIYDPADANRDGTISATERAGYSARQVEATGETTGETAGTDHSNGSAGIEAYQRVMDDASRAQMDTLLSSLSSIADNVLAS